MVSVITPCYNAAATLRRAHESLLTQECAWTHVVVDDGSTDNTGALIKELSRDSRVIPLQKHNGGTGSALNHGIRRATGGFVAFLDADDEYLPRHLASHLAVMNERPDVDLLWGGVEIVVDRPEDAMVPDIVAGFGFVSAAECVVQGTIFARRRVFETCMFTEDRAVWWQDYEFVQRVKEHYRVERFVDTTYRYYRNGGGSLVGRVKENWPRTAGELPRG
jgi:glycosyltransferase involved in cell wall biosynthesis